MQIIFRVAVPAILENPPDWREALFSSCFHITDYMKNQSSNQKRARFLRWANHLTNIDAQVFEKHLPSTSKAEVAILRKAAKQQFKNITVAEANKIEAIVLLTGRPVFLVKNDKVSINGTVGEWNERIAASDDVIKEVAASVGRIEMNGAVLDPGGNERSDQMIGTGFAVARNVIMTNRHVAEVFCNEDGSVRNGTGARIDFVEEYERDPDASFRIVRALEIGTDYDYAILQVEGGPDFPQPLALGTVTEASPMVFTLGYPAFDTRNPTKVQRDLFSNVFEVKRFAPGRLRGEVPMEGLTLWEGDYTTLGGNSGSPVIDFESGEVLGLHFAGSYLEGNYSVPASVLKPRIAAAVSRMQSEQSRPTTAAVGLEFRLERVISLLERLVPRRAAAFDVFKESKAKDGESARQFDPDEVFNILCREVYHNSQLQPHQIRPFHSLELDLGYAGSSKRGLSTRTNQAFGLIPPHFFTGTDFNGIGIVREHHAETCKHLNAAGRLLT